MNACPVHGSRARAAGLVVSTWLLAIAICAPQPASAQPTSAERPALKAGDRWKFEQKDRRTGVKESELVQQITQVAGDRVEGTENGEPAVWSPEFNLIDSATLTITSEAKRLSFPLEAGKKWEYKYAFVNKKTTVRARWQVEARVASQEKVKVPAGDFDAYKVEYRGYWNNDTSGRSGRLSGSLWYAPAARNIVKVEYEDGYNNWVRELVELSLAP